MQFTNRTLAVAMRAALVLALGAFPATSGAHDQEGRAAAGEDSGGGLECSDRTLRGDYGFRVDGTILTGPAPVLLRAVAMTHFDGHGNLTQVDFATMNGVPSSPNWRPATGTYAVNADCTGSAVIVPAFGPTINLRLVVFDGGDQVATVVIGNATGSVGTRVR
jgi:hypothetical protein